MRLPWHRKPDVTGGQQAREKAERELEEIRAETPKYAQLAAELREIRRRNHLAEAFYIAARGRPPT